VFAACSPPVGGRWAFEQDFENRDGYTRQVLAANILKAVTAAPPTNVNDAGSCYPVPPAATGRKPEHSTRIQVIDPSLVS
jgi:hypothetical protein